jgi:hypothetical protein
MRNMKGRATSYRYVLRVRTKSAHNKTRTVYRDTAIPHGVLLFAQSA